ncbi:MAG: tetratricopeptide repeat protein [Fimbriimonadaceae bacterium]|nr:tetratricopeptide repeat protein [Fimbriimonadaceae bacterium]
MGEQQSRFYGREAELGEIQRHLDSPGRILAYWGPTGIGKSMLKNRALDLARVRGHVTAQVDFDARLFTDYLGEFRQVLHRLAVSTSLPCPRFAIAETGLFLKSLQQRDPANPLLGHWAAPVGECLLGGLIDLALQPGAAIASVLKSGILLRAERIHMDRVSEFKASPEGTDLIARLDSLSEDQIRQELPGLLAEDWRQEAGGQPVSVFLDTFERVQRLFHNQPHEQWVVEESFLKLQELTADFAAWVVFSQDRLNWARETDRVLEDRNLILRSLEGLDRASAAEAIRGAGVERTVLIDRILDFSRESGQGGSTRHHGLTLRLAADYVVEACRQNPSFGPEDFDLPNQDVQELVRKFMSIHADRDGLNRLAVTPRFNQAALGFAFGLGRRTEQISLWNRAADWPFLSVSRDSDWRTLHPQFRAALLDVISETPGLSGFLEAAEEEWQEFWQDQGEASLAFRHEVARVGWPAAKCLDEEMDQLLQSGRTQEHHARLSRWSDAEEVLGRGEIDEQCRFRLAWAGHLSQSTVGDLASQQLAAVDLFRLNSRHWTRQTAPVNWAGTQMNLGMALRNLGEREDGTNCLEAAVEAFEQALTVFTPQSDPLNWGGTQMNLGAALFRLGERDDGTERLESAVVAFEEALKVFTAQFAPTHRAGTLTNLGVALRSLGEREAGTECLQAAVGAFEQALTFFSPQSDPMNWALTQMNLGGALCRLGEREEATERLQSAVEAFEQALTIFSPQSDPLNWASTHMNLGAAQIRLGEREDGTERLMAAVRANEQALKVFTPQFAPMNWALTQMNLGTALARLGEREDGLDRLMAAVRAFQQALEVFTPESAPMNWASTMLNLGVALFSLGDREDGTERLEAAVGAYGRALTILTPKSDPMQWALAQMNLGNALIRLGEREEGTERLEAAVGAYEQALTVFRPEVSLHMNEALDEVIQQIKAEIEARRGRS